VIVHKDSAPLDSAVHANMDQRIGTEVILQPFVERLQASHRHSSYGRPGEGVMYSATIQPNTGAEARAHMAATEYLQKLQRAYRVDRAIYDADATGMLQVPR